MEKLHQFAKNPRKRRRGYRLVHKELERQKAQEGKPLNVKRIHRLWRREGLSIPPRRRKKKIRSGKPATDLVAVAPNSVWCLDFIHEKSIHQQVLRILCVSDEFTRELLVIEVETRFVSSKVVAALKRLIVQRGLPGALRMDNGPEFIALTLRGFCHRAGIDPAYIDPGKPWQNGFAEGLHSRLRDEFMDGEVFYGVRDARVRLESWRRYFNEERLHSSLGYRTPAEFAASWEALKADEVQASAGSTDSSPAAQPAGEQQNRAGTQEPPGT